MDEQRAREILGNIIKDDGCLDMGRLPRKHDPEDEYGVRVYVYWIPRLANRPVTLDGDFTADELEAILWWMRNKAT